jgi:hypothetical protein
MDPTLMTDEHLIRRISTEWVTWRNHKRYYPNMTMWWERYVKNTFGFSSAKKIQTV